MVYLNIKKYQEVINYLDKFKMDDLLLGLFVKGGIGDVFVQLNQLEEVYKYYKEVIVMSDNEMIVLCFLLKVGIIVLNLGKVNEVYEFFNRIIEEFIDVLEVVKVIIYKG